MAKALNVDTCRESFEYQIDVAKRLTKAVVPLKAVNHVAGENLHSKHVRRIVELAFMGVVSSWEDFLEQTMVRYLAGAKSKSGFGAPHKVGLAKSILHAYRVISREAKYDPKRNYLSWTCPSEVLSRADFFFVGGAPYHAPIQQFHANVQRAISIRNRVAHASEKCKADFKIVACEFLNVAKLTKSYGAGDLLQAPAARHFGKAVANSGKIYLEAYLDMFEAMAKKIVP